MNLPPINRLPRPVREVYVHPTQVAAYNVSSAGPSGATGEVHFWLEADDRQVVLVFRTRESLEKLRAILERHANDVWPTVRPTTPKPKERP